MKKIFTMALVMLFALSLSAQDFGLANQKNNLSSVQQMKMKADNSKTSTNVSVIRNSSNTKATFIAETFETEIPATWTVTNDPTTGFGWAWDDGSYSSYPYGKGNACANGDLNGGIGITYLTSPVADCSAATSLFLEFNYQFQKYSTDPDNGTVEVWDGTAWVILATYDTDILPTSASFDITAYKNAALQVRFKYEDAGNWDWFMNVSDVIVFEPVADDLGVTSAAPGFVLFGETATPSLMVKNFGANTQNDFDIDIVINDGTTDVYTYNESITGAAIASDATVEYTAATTWTPAAEGSYTITATVTLAGDLEPANDEFVGAISVVNPSYTNNNSYGYNAFDDSGSGLAGFIVSNPLETGLLNGLAAGTSGDFLACGDMIDGIAYGAEYGTNDVYLVNGDGASFLMGTITGLTDITGLAQDPVSGIVYATDYDGAASNLYSVDETFAATFIGQINAGLIIGIAADADGNLYGIDMVDDNFYSIDKTTGAGTIVGSLGIDIAYAQDLGSDKINNIIYGTLYDATAGGGLYTVDMTTGAATLINTFADEVTMSAVYTTSGVGVKSVQNNGIYVYPNPSTGVFVVAAEGTNTVDVVDITGKVIMSKTFNTNTTIEINNAGMYFLRITNEKGTSVEKVIVE